MLLQVFLASVIGLTSGRPEESAQFDKTDESEGFLNVYNYYGSSGSVGLVEPEKDESLCEPNTSEKLEIFAEEDEEDDYDYGCPKECVEIIDDFIENRREDDFMYYYGVYKCTMDTEGCRFLYLDTAGFRKRAKRDDSDESDDSLQTATDAVDFFNIIGMFFANLFA